MAVPYRCVPLLALLLASSGRAHAQEAVAPPDSAHKPTHGTIVPLPVVFYQPETGTGFGALVTYYFRPGETARSEDPPSEVGGYAIYTTRKQILTAIGTQLYLSGGSLRLGGNVAFTKFPTKFWGIGNDTPDEAEEDYTPLSVVVSAEAQREVSSGWFVGGRVQFAQRTLHEVSDSGQLVTGTVPGSADGHILEGTLLLTRDRRDNRIFPTSGQYHQLSVLGAATALGSDYGYAGVRLDLRGYFSPFAGHVVALRAIGDARSGTPPFDLLPQLGGDGLLRGYYAGRFRDKVLIALQGEYRLQVIWRLSLVGFAESGQVASRFDDLAFDRFKVSAGGGLRFRLSPKEGINIRADYGWGFDVHSGGFYLAIGEAF